MKIVRDGKEYELTSNELYEAYREQEALYDIDDVKSELECIADGDDENLRTVAARVVLADDCLLKEVAHQKRRNEDKYGMNWNAAVHDAVADMLESVRKRV